MKKLLLMVASLAFLMLGAVSFTSCGDDDKDNGTSNSLVDKYGSKKGVFIDGDNVVASIGYGSVTVYSFSSDDKLEKATQYNKYASNEVAKIAYDNFKNEEGTSSRDLKLDGNVISYVVATTDLDGISKSDLVKALETSPAYQ